MGRDTAMRELRSAFDHLEKLETAPPDMHYELLMQALEDSINATGEIRELASEAIRNV